MGAFCSYPAGASGGQISWRPWADHATSVDLTTHSRASSDGIAIASDLPRLTDDPQSVDIGSDGEVEDFHLQALEDLSSTTTLVESFALNESYDQELDEMRPQSCTGSRTLGIAEPAVSETSQQLESDSSDAESTGLPIPSNVLAGIGSFLDDLGSVPVEHAPESKAEEHQTPCP